MPDAPLIPESIGSAVDRRGVGARRWWALGALVMGGLAVGLDATVLSVAPPTLARKLHASESDLQWFSSGYLLVLAAAMLPLGLLGDRYGRKRVLLGSFALFAVGSAACAASPSSSAFIAARVLLGLAGAGVTVMGFATLPVLFGEGERPRAVGMMAAATFVSLPLGLARLVTAGLPAAAATAARQSVFGAVAVAHQLRSPELLASAHSAFAHGMDVALVVSGAVALVGLPLTVAFLPRVNAVKVVEPPPGEKPPAVVAVA